MSHWRAARASVPSGLAPFLKGYSLPGTINSTLLRLDHQINNRARLFLRAAYTPSSDEQRTLSNRISDSSNQQTYAGGFDTQLANSLTDEFRIGYSRGTAKDLASLDGFGGAIPVNLGQALGNAASSTAYNDVALYFNGVGSTSIGTQFLAAYQRQWNVTDTVSVVKANHRLKIGADFRRITSAFVFNDPVLSPYYLLTPA